MVCATCNKVVDNNKEAVKCAECEATYHVSCCRIRTVAKLNKLSANAVATWKCDGCKQESASVASRSDNEEQTVIDMLKSMQLEISSNHKENKDSFTALNVAVSTIQETLISVQQRTTKLESDYSALKCQNEALSKEKDQLSNQVDTLQSTLEDLQQYTRSANIEVKGVPSTPGEDVYYIMECTARALGVCLSRGDISAAHRLRPPRNGNGHPSIVVQFVSRTTRAVWLEAARKKRISTTDLAPTLQPGPVYVNEHLTGLNKTLLGRSKSYVRTGNLLSAWCHNGAVMVRKTMSSPPARMRTLMDVEAAAGKTGVRDTTSIGGQQKDRDA